MTKLLLTRIWRMAIAICMIGAICAAVPVSDLAEQGEQVEDVLELEANELLVNGRQSTRRKSGNRDFSHASFLSHKNPTQVNSPLVPRTERSRINGLGTHIRV